MTGQQARQATDFCAQRIELGEVSFAAQCLDGVDMMPVVRIVDERPEMDVVARAQVPQQMIRTDLVTLVGRERHPVHEIEQVVHDVSRDS